MLKKSCVCEKSVSKSGAEPEGRVNLTLLGERRNAQTDATLLEEIDNMTQLEAEQHSSVKKATQTYFKEQ